MHICPTCNREIEDPEYVKPPRANPLLGSAPWQVRYGDDQWPVEPVCPCGRPLRNWIIGEFRELSPVMASLKGLFTGTVSIVLAAVIDQMRRRQGAENLLVLPIAIAAFAGLGLAALWMALNWSTDQGPVTRLAARAYGVAAGYLVPAGLLAIAILTGAMADLSPFDPIVKLLPLSK